VWSAVANYRDDFKPGGPAPGWKYAWSAGGKAGDASTYAPLQWSDSAGVYNTTGFATPEWNGAAHNDDYLKLGDEGGHPGRANFAVIAGYTIQAEDGAGLYRLAGSSIAKANGTVENGEDGLDLSVYLNNTLLGGVTAVSTSGSIATFNRNLGQLAVGDTVYVAVGQAGNQLDDLFKGFNFSIERGVLDPNAPPPPPPPPPPTWAAIADFRDDFQTGAPAPGWKYLWSAGGKPGDAASYAPLAWSESAGVYNTTGAATTEWNGAAHNDDYLKLGLAAGHPGRPNYSVIAGYTIQAEDGAGVYRLVSGTISKGDAAVQPGEDGLDVSIFVNNTLRGATIPISASGVLASFSRELGQLAVGDTIYVTINAAGNQLYDLFGGFDFTIEKQVPVAAAELAANVQAVPEPSSIALAIACTVGLALSGFRRHNR
jgi:hypothetical protein